MELFHFDRAGALAAITDPDGALWPVNAYSDADELDALLAAAIDAGILARAHPRARLYVYPLSLSEPEPLLAVDPGSGPTLLGCALKLAEREDEDPVSFTLRLLDEMVAEANRLVAAHCTDGAHLDRIAAYMNHHRPWNGGDVCEVVAMELRESGRPLAEDAAETEPPSAQNKSSAASSKERKRKPS